MTLTRENYKKRLIDDKLSIYLNIFGAVLIEGPKWCGKTWTALNHANSATFLTDSSSKDLASINPRYIFTNEYPQLIDEWQIVPAMWDSVRHVCDEDNKKGKFILTGSTSLSKAELEKEVFHSGAGRIASLKMETMSLFELGKSSGNASITAMKNDTVEEKYERKVELDEIADYVIRGGWPENIDTPSNYIQIIPQNYLESVIEKDIHERKDKKIDTEKIRMLIRSLARSESTTANNNTIIKDIEEYEDKEELLKSRNTVSEYINALSNLYLIQNQNAFNINYRSSARVGKSVKRHLIDPSLSCASLNLSVEKLMLDHKTFGYMFEALVEHELRIYMNSLNGEIYHFRDNVSGDEVDAILEFEDGEYAAVEIKLSYLGIDDAKASLCNFYKNAKKKPTFMCIVVGVYEAIIKDPDTGIYIVPITSLRP